MLVNVWVKELNPESTGTSWQRTSCMGQKTLSHTQTDTLWELLAAVLCFLPTLPPFFKPSESLFTGPSLRCPITLSWRHFFHLIITLECADTVPGLALHFLLELYTGPPAVVLLTICQQQAVALQKPFFPHYLDLDYLGNIFCIQVWFIW